MARKLAKPKNFRYIEPRSCCMMCEYLVSRTARTVWGVDEKELVCKRDEDSTPETSEFYNYVCDGFSKNR